MPEESTDGSVEITGDTDAWFAALERDDCAQAYEALLKEARTILMRYRENAPTASEALEGIETAQVPDMESGFGDYE